MCTKDNTTEGATHTITYLLPAVGAIECHIHGDRYLHEIVTNLKYILTKAYTDYKTKAHGNDNYVVGPETLLVAPAKITICRNILLTCTLEPSVLYDVTIANEMQRFTYAFICTIQAQP